MAKLRDGTVVQGNETVTGNLTVNGAISGATVNTGHGANELYPMNQGVKTTDNVTFNNLNVTGNAIVNGSLVVKGIMNGGNDLASASWEQISEIIGPEDVLNIGDEKTIKIGGTNYIAQIYGFHHDDRVGGGKARITFGLKGLYPPTKKHQETDTNAGGWNASLIRSYLNGTVYNALPSDLKSVIKQVNKPTANGGSQAGTIVVDSEDKLFLFSEVEVFGTNGRSRAGEGSKYPIFTDSSSSIKGSDWWLRSPIFSNVYTFCRVLDNGGLYNTEANFAHGVAFGFCV